MSVKNSRTRVAWSLKKESASLIIENFKEGMDHYGAEDIISSEVFLVYYLMLIPKLYFHCISGLC